MHSLAEELTRIMSAAEKVKAQEQSPLRRVLYAHFEHFKGLTELRPDRMEDDTIYKDTSNGIGV